MFNGLAVVYCTERLNAITGYEIVAGHFQVGYRSIEKTGNNVCAHLAPVANHFLSWLVYS